MYLPIEGADYFIRIISFPVPVAGAVRQNSDGTYSVYLSAELFGEARLNAYEHELWHMIRDDLNGEKSAWKIEREGA